MEAIASMVTIEDGKTPGYTISLDEIDLSLMPIFSHQRRDRTVPLWSPAASGPGAEYYEFQVLTEEGGDSDDERLENAPTVRCHVCATSVSVSHWQRHATSAIHQANQTIAQISLSRAQQMALAPPVILTPPTSSTSFCPPCCTAVSFTKRATHKHSDQHSSSVLYAKLIQSLAKLYDSKDNLNNVCEEVFKAIGDHETIYADLQSRLFFEGEILTKKKKKKEIYKDDAKKKQNEEFDDNDAVVHEGEIPQTNLKKEENENYEKKIHKEENYDDYGSRSTSESEDSRFTTKCQDSYGKTLCLACRVMVVDKQKHVLMKTHADKVTMKDQHCIRPITTIIRSGMLCNDLVGNSGEGQKTFDTHNTAFQRALIQDDIRGKPEDTYTNKQNKPVVSGSSQNISGNMDTNTEKVINMPIIVGAEAKLPENTVDTYVKNGYCYVCDRKVPNNVSNIKGHVKGKNHKQNLLSLQSNNSTVKINYVRPICNIIIPENSKNVINDLKSTMHKVNVNTNSTQNVTTAGPNRTNIDTGSSVSVSKISDIKDEASRGKTSDNVQDTNSNAHESKTIMQGDEKIRVVHNTNDTNTATDSIFYVGTYDSEVSKNEYAKTENTTTNNTICAKTTNDSNKAYDSVDNDASNTTTDSSSNVGTSNSGVNKNDYAKTKKTKTSKPVDDSEDNDANTSDIFYNCKTEGDVTDDSDVEALDEGFYICRVCDKLILDNETDIKSHLDSFRHKINLKEKQFKEGMFPNTTTVCDICKVDVPNNPIANKKHAESEMHKWRFEKILLENNIKMKDGKVCYCEVCDLYFSKFTVSSHINRSNHVKHFNFS